MWGSSVCQLNTNTTIAHIGTSSISTTEEPIDVLNWDSTFFDGFLNLEYTTNSLAYDSNFNKVVIDLTGTGVEDTCNRKIRIPVTSNEWNQWYTVSKGFRYWKLRRKGYTAYDTATFDFITENVKSNISANTNNFLKFYCNTLLGGIYKNSQCTQCNGTTQAQQTYNNLFTEDLGASFWSENIQTSLENSLKMCSSGILLHVSQILVIIAFVFGLLLAC